MWCTAPEMWRFLIPAQRFWLVVIPAVFAFGMDVSAGPPLMFITLPSVFQQMPFGQIFAIVFFIAVLFAAINIDAGGSSKPLIPDGISIR